jgi:hypothetical protein
MYLEVEGQVCQTINATEAEFTGFSKLRVAVLE